MAGRYLLNRKQRQWLSLAIFVISLAVYFGQLHGWFGGIKQAAEVNQPGLYTVVHYDDGDTIIVDMNGTQETLRFIGVDTPETHKPNTPVQCYGPAAAAFTKNLIGGQRVRLEADSLNTNRDRYNRLLRYVYLPDGTLINKQIIANGYGFYYPYFPFSKAKEFAAAQGSAQAAHKGLWGNCRPVKTEGGGYLSNNQI